MKRSGLFVLITLCFTMLVKAQDVYVPYVIQEYPVQFKYLQGHQITRVSPFTYVVEEPNTFAQFYIKGMKVSETYSADSLQAYFMKLYEGEDLVNLQLREKGRGSLGDYEADRLVLSFMADDKMYLTTVFLVYFHINDTYNSILFYFEMNERNVISYEGVMVNMAQTLEWLELTYTPFVQEEYGVKAELPDFWKSHTETLNDSTYFISLHDGRGRMNITIMQVSDSCNASDIAKAAHKALKTEPGIYAGHKLKVSSDKWFSGEACGRWLGTYDVVKDGYKRNQTLNRYYIKRIVDNKLMLYTIDLLCPSYNVSYYQPIFDRMGKSIQIPGNPFIAPKK